MGTNVTMGMAFSLLTMMLMCVSTIAYRHWISTSLGLGNFSVMGNLFSLNTPISTMIILYQLYMRSRIDSKAKLGLA